MFNDVITILNNLKMRTKLYLSFIIVVFVPVCITGLVLLGELRLLAINNASEQTAINVERIKKRTSDVINVTIDAAYRLTNDSKLTHVVNNRYESTYEVVNAYREYQDFNEILRLYKEINNIRFYMDNPTMLDNWQFLQPTEQIRRSSWYQQAEGSSFSSWHYMQDERDKQHYLSLVKKISFNERRTSGILVLNVNMALLREIVSQEPFETMIVDDGGRIVAANRPGRTGLAVDDIDWDYDVMQEESGVFQFVLEGSKSEVRVERLMPDSSENGLRIISVFAIDTIMQDVNRINKLVFVVITVSLIVAIALIHTFSALLSSRMLRLSKQMTRVGTGNLKSVMEIDGYDEIGQLSRHFNAMVANIQELMAEVGESNRQKRLLEAKQSEIRFKMMASQIHPHFLFNALESIRMKAHLKGEKEIARVVRLLGKLMRRNLEVGKRYITIAEELNMVSCYLDIQMFRHEDRLHYALLMDPEVADVELPPLIIQPLVENAVLHGLENKVGSGSVTVRAVAVKDEVMVEVSDDGVGMEPALVQRLEEAFAGLNEEEHSRIGMMNVHLRLVLSYGPEHGLQIASGQGMGTRIRFTIPNRGN